MTNEEYAQYRKIRNKCDELALTAFEDVEETRPDDLAAVSFQFLEVIRKRQDFIAGRPTDED